MVDRPEAEIHHRQTDMPVSTLCKENVTPTLTLTDFGEEEVYFVDLEVKKMGLRVLTMGFARIYCLKAGL
ncbi:MAG: hypothetical protein ACRD8U_14800 [Pyrinomonadaceae bacterium]